MVEPSANDRARRSRSRRRRCTSRSEPASRWVRFARFVLPPLAVAAAVIGMWLFVTYSLLREDQRPFLPPPQDVVSRGLPRLGPPATDPRGTRPARRAVAVTGLAIAFVIGTAVAVVMSQTMWLERTLYPYAVILQTVPLVAIAPLVGLKMGFSNTSRIVICVIISMFPIIANTLFGLKSATAAAARPLPAASRQSRWTRLWKLQFPAALPSIFAGLRIAAGLSVIGAIVGEFFFRAGDPPTAGLGRQLSVYQSQQRTHLVITALFFSCLLGVALFAIFTVIGTRLTRSWSDDQRRPAISARANGRPAPPRQASEPKGRTTCTSDERPPSASPCSSPLCGGDDDDTGAPTRRRGAETTAGAAATAAGTDRDDGGQRHERGDDGGRRRHDRGGWRRASTTSTSPASAPTRSSSRPTGSPSRTTATRTRRSAPRARSTPRRAPTPGRSPTPGITLEIRAGGRSSTSRRRPSRSTPIRRSSPAMPTRAT